MQVKDKDQETLSADLLQALAHPLRLKLLKRIGRKRVCQCELAGLLQEHPVNISRHLSVLERSGLITFEKEGTRLYPRIAFPESARIIRDAETLGRRIIAGRAVKGSNKKEVRPQAGPDRRKERSRGSI